jgi:hypothetical protein
VDVVTTLGAGPRLALLLCLVPLEPGNALATLTLGLSPGVVGREAGTPQPHETSLVVRKVAVELNQRIRAFGGNRNLGRLAITGSHEIIMTRRTYTVKGYPPEK